MQNKTYKTISLFSGYLGLDIGVSKAIGEGELVGWSDIEPGPLALGSHHAPKARRLGDITKIDWEKYKDIEVMAGGFCCQSLSLAGFRAGLKAGTRSGLWLDYAKGIGIIRPSLVVAENVAGLLSGISVSKEDERMDALRSEALDKAGLCSCEIPDLELPDGFEAPDPKEETSQPLAVVLRGFLHADPERCSPVTCRQCGRRVFEVRGDMVLADDERLSGVHTAPTIRALGRVLGDLANLGYDAVWRGLEAADIGAPPPQAAHLRDRMAARSEVGARTVERPAEASRPTAAHEAEGARMGRVGCGQGCVDDGRAGSVRGRGRVHGRVAEVRRDGRRPRVYGARIVAEGPGAGGRFRFGDAEGVRRGEGRPGPGVWDGGCAPARAGCGDPGRRVPVHAEAVGRGVRRPGHVGPPVGQEHVPVHAGASHGPAGPYGPGEGQGA